MYLVFAEWEGDVSYGVYSATYILAITDDDHAAMNIVQEFGPRLTDCRIGESFYYEIPEDKRDLFEKKYSIFCNHGVGVYMLYCSEFKPGMFCGGGFYLE